MPQKGTRIRLVLLVLALFIGKGIYADEAMRILKLLPNLKHPPLVEPHLPNDFVLGHLEDDPEFLKGYYWGNLQTLATYFQDSSSLNGCLIRAQIAKQVHQTGLDRFSSDGKIEDLTAAGFSGITVNRGHWGIFPFREMQAKGPKGRHYYQMWLGLNDEKGTAIYFQLIYPEYLTEPTQSQKNLWKNFVKKTQFLSYEDLLVLRESPAGEKTDYAYFKIEKRRSDHKFFIQATPANENAHIQIQEIKDHQPISGHFGRPFLEISLLIITEDHSIVEDIVRISYKTVDQFSFSSAMLNLKSFEEYPDYLLLHKQAEEN